MSRASRVTITSYISATVTGGRVVIIAKREEEARRLLELLRSLGIEAVVTGGSLCG